jgi:hypothetical protein
MGEVYRVLDHDLQRTVAVGFSPALPPIRTDGTLAQEACIGLITPT